MLSLSTFQYIFFQWVDHLILVWDFFNTPLQTLIDRLPALSGAWVGLGVAVSVMGVQNLTLLEFMFGTGILLYLGYQFVTWVFNLIT